MELLNLHLTGDFHAVTAAHNLLSAMVDNHLHQGNELDLDIHNITWRRVLDVNDRALRNIIVGLGGKADGVTRQTGFDITAASEVMAIWALSTSAKDLRARLGRIVVGYNRAGEPGHRRAAEGRRFSPSSAERVRFWLSWGGSAALTVYCLYRFGFLSRDFLHGVTKFAAVVVAQLFPPTGFDQLPMFLKVMGETIAMAFLGTLLGAAFAFPLSFVAAKNMTRSRPVQFGTRRFADLLRSFDYLIWALIFVRAIGLGPLAGIMAIAIVETGTFIKLYSRRSRTSTASRSTA